MVTIERLLESHLERAHVRTSEEHLARDRDEPGKLTGLQDREYASPFFDTHDRMRGERSSSDRLPPE